MSERAQASTHGAEDMEDVVELGATRAEGSKEPIRSYDDRKPYVGASSEAPLQIGEDIPYYLPNLVPKSDFLQEGAEGGMAILAKIGLLRFATWTSNIPLLDSKLVQTFLEKYNPPERKAEFFQLAFIQVDVERVTKHFWLPTRGVSVSSLTNLEFNVSEAFLAGTSLEELDDKQRVVEVKKAPKEALLPIWQPWVHWVQTYLEIDADSLQVSLGTVKAAMAIKAGVRLNWSKFLTRQLHDAVVATLKEPTRICVAGQHLTHLIREQLGPLQTNRVKMIKSEEVPTAFEGGESSTPVVFDPKAEMKRALQELQRKLEEPSEAELLVENLQAINTQLVNDLEAARKVMEESILKQEALQTHYDALLQDKQAAYEALEHQLGRAKARVYDLDTDLKASRYEVRKLEDALAAERQPQSQPPIVDPVLPVSISTLKREAEFCCSFQELKDLLELVPPTANLEHAYSLDRQVFYTLFQLEYRERLDPHQFETIWHAACTYELENLLTEMVLRADLELVDKPVAYIRIGDFGLHRLLYYAKLEADLGQRRELASSAYKGVHPNLIGGEFTWDIGSAIRFWTQDGAFRAWKNGLEQLHAPVKDKGWLTSLVEDTKRR